MTHFDEIHNFKDLISDILMKYIVFLSSCKADTEIFYYINKDKGMCICVRVCARARACVCERKRERACVRTSVCVYVCRFITDI